MLAALSGARATTKAGGLCGDRIISAAHVCCGFSAPSLNPPAAVGATGFSAIGRLWHQRLVVGLKAFHFQPASHRTTENSNGPSGSPGDSHLVGGPELGICLLWSLLRCLWCLLQLSLIRLPWTYSSDHVTLALPPSSVHLFHVHSNQLQHKSRLLFSILH